MYRYYEQAGSFSLTGIIKFLFSLTMLTNPEKSLNGIQMSQRAQVVPFELHHEKTGFLTIRKQNRRSASQ